MLTVAVCSMKGGVGKTTTAVHLGAALAAFPGTRVLLVDLDAQGSLARWFGFEARERNVLDVLLAAADVDSAKLQLRPRLYLLPADERLYSLETRIVVQEHRTSRLHEVLSGQHFSHVVIDTGPSLSWAMLNGLYAADLVLVPVVLEALPLSVLADYLRLLRGAIEREGLRARLGGLVPTFFEARTRTRRQAYEELQGTFGELVRSPIHASVKVPEAAALNRTVFEHAPKSQAAQDYAQLTREVLQWQAARSQLSAR